MKCINHTHADYIALNEVVSDRLLLDAVINKWQEDNKSDLYPTVKEVITLLNDSNTPYYSKDFKDGGKSPQFKKKANEVDFVLRSVELLSSDKAKQVFAKGEKNKWDMDKILLEIGIPKLQKQIILSLGKTNREEIITDLLANYSYTIEINVAFDTKTKAEIDMDEDSPTFGEAKYFTKTDKTKKSQYYSNLTVPGGTNYTEQEITTPAITPSIKGHAEFATDNGIGWFRSDDKDNRRRLIKDGDLYFEEIEGVGMSEISKEEYYNEIGVIDTNKTRRILEVQSDLFQKGRDKDLLVNSKFKTDDLYQDIEVDEDGPSLVSIPKEGAVPIYNKNQNQFLQLLNKDNNWVTFFVKSIIQDSAKQTITEVQESDVEAKVRELEREGLLEIDCKGKLKAEKGLQTNFTKGGKWKLIKDLKGYPTHKEGGVDLTIGKDGVKIKNGTTKFTAKHGLVIPKN